MSFATALRKARANGRKPVDGLHAIWKAPRRRARTRRLFWAAGLLVGLGALAALLWLALARED